ncbi:magnesium transporter CorA family protein [Candidatus Uhrbacteria bacterium]|nr:magnesium transporter CorA family protein [Candidatus Uhrbacteria bacterium]
MTNKILEVKDIGWIHISRVNEADLDYLKQNFKFHHLDYDDIRAGTSLSKIDTYKHYLFFTFHIPVLKKDGKTVGGNELYIFLNDKNIITLTREPIVSIEKLYDHMEKVNKFRNNVLSKGPAFMLYRILMDAFRETQSIVSFLTSEVARLEEAINNSHDKKITVDLGKTRRNILFLRHLIDPQRTIVSNLTVSKRQFISEDFNVYFDDLKDSLDTVWSSTDNLKLFVDGLFDVNEALLSHKTNDVITFLTIISASIMVPTFIAGFYGMNVPWLPFAHRPDFVFFIFVFSLLVMFAIVMFIVKKHRL